MNTNIYRHELKRSRASFLVWGICISVFILIGMVSYPVFMQGDTLTQVRALFENPFMKNIISAFGTNIDALTNILGFYAFRSAAFVMLLGSFFSILLAGKILAQEEHEKTAEFLLSKPVTRSEVVWSKLAAFLTYLLLLNGIILLVGFTCLEVFKGDGDYPLTAFLVHTFYAFLMMLTFGAAGLFLSLWIKRGRPITSLLIGVIMGSYFFDVFSKVTKSLDIIGYVSPFKFVDSGVLRPDYGLVWWRVLYFLGISLVLFTLSFLIYRKKDILV